MEPEPIRFADILTMASSVATFLAAPEVTAAHAIDGIAILRGERRIEDLGRPLSPLLRRAQQPQGGGVEPALRELVQRWYVRLGSPDATLDDGQLSEFLADLQAIAGQRGEPS
ncbi:MAG: hypothetical protein ACM3S1_14240 [Hyphomicrobiales bacterium]